MNLTKEAYLREPNKRGLLALTCLGMRVTVKRALYGKRISMQSQSIREKRVDTQKRFDIQKRFDTQKKFGNTWYMVGCWCDRLVDEPVKRSLFMCKERPICEKRGLFI